MYNELHYCSKYPILEESPIHLHKILPYLNYQHHNDLDKILACHRHAHRIQYFCKNVDLCLHTVFADHNLM
ncbi:hypothetical protein D3C84_886970 [compost metagenome]